jgi:hypothetical protein
LILEKALGQSREALSLSYLGHVYGRLARTDEARHLLRELEQLRTQGKASAMAFAVIHAGLGEVDAAFEWLEAAYRLRDGSLFWLPGAPGLDPLHSDARFADLLRRVGVVPLDSKCRVPRGVSAIQGSVSDRRRRTGPPDVRS